MKPHLLCALALVAVSCELTELVTPDPGSCDDELNNAWPKFEGNEGKPPVITDAEFGYQVGQIPPDFALVDQNGQETCLRQMYGKYVILDSSALWCRPCRIIAETVACTQETFGDDVVYMTFITEGSVNGTPATSDDVEQWSTSFGLGEGTLTPVLNDGGTVFTEGFPGDGLPAFVLLGPDLRVIMSGEGEESEREIKNELAKRLNVEVPDCHSE